jgi:hypothetical protein
MDTDSEKFKQYIASKYVDSYYENNYTIENGIIIRRHHSDIESQNEKGVCLYQCFLHFTKSYIEEASTAFECNNETGGFQTRCCCSQREENGLNNMVVTHVETGIKFVIGAVCFKKLFAGEKDKLKYFFKEKCKECSEKVKKRNKKRPNFCSMKCCNTFNEREEKIRIKKLWDDEAPKREAERKARLAEIEEEEKRKQEIKKKFPYGIWLNCQRCDRENKLDKQKKYKFCENCCN